MIDSDAVVEHKRGTTFAYAGFGRLPAGTWTARSQLRARNGGAVLATLLSTLTEDATQQPNTHALAISSVDDTDGWAVGEYFWDIKFYDTGGVKLATQTRVLAVVERVTRDV